MSINETPLNETVRVRVNPLSEEAFAPFGEVLAAKNRAPDFSGISSVGWKSPFDCTGPPEIMIYSSRYTGMRFTKLECHLEVTQTFVPLAGIPALVAVATPTSSHEFPAPEDVYGFLLDGSAGYVLKLGAWHSLDRFPLYPPSSDIVIITARKTQHELETVDAEHWQRTNVIDYAGTYGVTFEFEF